MQNCFTVNVKTEDGELLIREKITCDLSNLYWQLSQLFNRYSLVGKDFLKYETKPGSGIIPSASVSSQSTGS